MNRLPDLGTYYLANVQTKPGTPIYLRNCKSGVVRVDSSGMTNIAFIIYLDDEGFIGKLIVREEPDAVIKKLTSWGKLFHAKCQLIPERKYIADDGQEVIPFFGEVFRDIDEPKRAAEAPKPG